MVKDNRFKNKTEYSIWTRAFNFISRFFAPIINWFSSLFTQKEAPGQTKFEPTETLSKPAEGKPTTEALVAALEKDENALFEQLLNKAEPEVIKKNPSVLLYVAIEKGNLDTVKLLMSQGVELSSYCFEKNAKAEAPLYSALEIAIKHEHVDIVDLCLENGLKFKEEWLRPLVHSPEKLFNTEKAVAIFKLLLDKAHFSFSAKESVASSGHTYYWGALYLREATRMGHIKSIEQALKNNLVETVWPQEAIDFGELEIAKLFLDYTLEKAAELDFVEGYFYHLNKDTIFFKAVEENNLEIVKHLIKGHNVNLDAEKPVFRISAFHPSALYYAIENKNHEMVSLLLDSGATFGNIALSYSESHLAIIEAFEKEFRIALPNYKDNSIYQAYNNRRLEKETSDKLIQKAQALADARARANIAQAQERQIETQKENALLAAIRKNDIERLRRLLDEADPEKIQRKPSVLLYQAIVSGHIEAIKLLMSKGVDLNFQVVKNFAHDGYHERVTNALQLAIQHQHIELVNLCLDNNLEFEESYLDCIKEGNGPVFVTEKKKEIFKTLLDRVPFEFRSTIYGNMYSTYYREEAIRIGHIESLKRVLEKNDNQFDWVWLDEAIMHNQVEIAKLFLEYYRENKPAIGLCLNNAVRRVKSNSTRLYYAIENNQSEMVQLLLSEGATFGQIEHTAEQVAVIENYKKNLSKHKEEVQNSFSNVIPAVVVSLVKEYELPAYEVVPELKSKPSENSPSRKLK